MGTYRKEWGCCGSVTETDAWEPESCPFCTTAPSTSPASDAELPPLPEPEYCADDLSDIFTAAQMHAYARAALQARWCAEVNADGLREEIAELRARAPSTRTASDTRTAAESVECVSALRPEPASQRDAGGLVRAGWFIYEGVTWVATSSDDPRATILYRKAEAASQAPMRSIFFRDANRGRVLLNVLGVYPTFSGIEIEVQSPSTASRPQASAIEEELASRGGAQGRITCKESPAEAGGEVSSKSAETRMGTGFAPGGGSPVEVDVEAERKLYMKSFPWMPLGWTTAQDREFDVWLAARTQADAGQASDAVSLLAEIDAAMEVAWTKRDLPASVFSGDLVRRMKRAIATTKPENT